MISRLGIVIAALLVATQSAWAQVPGELRGRVTDAEAGRAIPGARIEIVGQAEPAISAVDGSFVVRGLDPRRLAVRIRALGYAPIDTVVVVANGRTTALDVALLAVATRLGSVVVQSNRDTASTSSFDRRAIERSGRRDLGELLQTVPGIVITQAGGPGSPSHISIRGSGANEVLVLVNGNAINSAITGQADLSRIGLETIDRVTVLPGAQSARYGGRALAGVVVIETRRAELEMSGLASVGSWGEQNVAVSIGQTAANDVLRVGGAITVDYRDVRGDFSYEVPALRGGGSARRFNADSRSVNALATTSLEGGSGTLQLRTEWQAKSRGLPGSIVQASTTGRQHDSRLTGGLDGHWGFGRIGWTASVDGTREHMAFADPAPPFGTVYDDAVDANSAALTTAATAGVGIGSLSLGAEARTLGVTSTMLAPDAPRRQRQLGTWTTAHASTLIAHSTELAADASARVDWDTFLDAPVVSPRAGLTASRGRGSLSAFIGGGYAPPSLADQFFHEGVLVRPNPALRPERVRNEVEVRGALRDTRVGAFDVSGEVAAYRADINGMILWQPDFRFIWSPANFDVRRTGWEASGRLGVPSLGADLRGSYSQTDVSYVGPVLSGQVAYRPRVTANAGGGVTRWSTRIDLGTRYVGERRTVPGSGLNMLDPYWLSDIKLSRPFVRGTWRIDVTLGVDNVFDRSAAMLVDYPFPGRAWTIALRPHFTGL